ncbi:phosphate transporter [Chlamydoabsidia padenii]|nr:phosphate transporter [Chlamydoabsidia padenii]
MMQPYDFTWIFGTGMVFAFMDAYGIGANDVSNAFATSISSGSLTLIQASIIACFTEFLGALLLGSSTSETIKGGILSVSKFVDQPEMLMLAMLCAVFGSAVWVVFASQRGWPVSTTHSIVGAICGVGIAAFGGDSLKWEWGGISSIITSWFLSPIAAGFVSAILYTITKYAVLRRSDSFTWGLRLVPAYFFFTAAINAFYIIYKGAPGTNAATLSVGVIVGISFGIGAFFAAFSWFFFVPWVNRRVKAHEDLRWYHVFVIPWVSKRPTLQQSDPEMHAPTAAATPSSGEPLDEPLDEKLKIKEEQAESVDQQQENSPSEPNPPLESKLIQLKTKAINFAMHGLRKDVRNLDSQHLKNVHAAAILYDDDAEYLFSFLQILTACMASFAHGSNDVANAVGPLASIFDIWQNATVDVAGKVPVPIWILAYGGVAIDLGLLTLGYKVMRKMGNNITYFSPSRGFCAELGAALTVLTCSKLGLPVSTTHCITGATAGVGLCNGNWRAINWKMLGWCFFSWFLTLPAAGLMSGLLFAFGSNAPNFVRL